MTDQIYNRFNPAKGYERHLFRSDNVLQSAELNEMQSNHHARLRALADVLFKEGDIIRGAQCIADPDTGVAMLESGELYIAGAVRAITAKNLTIATLGVVYVGAYLQSTIITELQDPELLNPAAGTRGYQQPGAARERIELVWGVQNDGTTGTFYPVWMIEDGWVRPKEPPPNLDAVTQALARYDRDSAGGTYVVRGLRVMMGADLVGGEQLYTLLEGLAHINGHALELPTSRRLVYPAAPDVQWVDSEPHASSTAGLQHITFDRFPVVGPVQVRIQARTTKTLTHGGFVGAADPLPDTAVVLVESITQGGTIYAKDIDWKLTAGQIDWSLSGAEPLPGSNYQATYQHMATVAAQNQTTTGFDVAGALPGTLVLTSYNFALRRIDRLAMDSEGLVQWIKGIAATWEPVAPKVPAGMLALASVYQSWNSNRRVVNDTVRVVPMDELVEYRTRLDDITTDLAEMRLAVDVSGRYSGIKKGLFADPLLDNSMRDAGLAQTAAVVAGALRLPLLIQSHALAIDMTERQAPAHNHRAVLTQTLQTGSMHVNPYDAFDVLPCKVTLKPSVDRWTDVHDHWSNPREEKFYSGNGAGVTVIKKEVVDITLSETSSAIETLRQIPVEFALQFGPGEGIASLTFDGLALTPQALAGGTLLANAQGLLSGTFTIPEKIPAGTKTVAFTGTGGSHGDALFTGQGTLVQREMLQITRYWYQLVDPLAQTFTLQETTQVTGVEVFFTTAQSTVQVQLREVDAGYPSPRVLAEAHVAPAQALTNGSATRVTWPPVQLDAGREYCIVLLCNDANTAVAVAELGGWDTTQRRFVTSQPYQVGVLLSSSNASTWTAHQDKDLAFRLLGADYTETLRTIELGTVSLIDATDLMINAYAHEPAAGATAVFVVQLADGTTIELAAGQVAQLPERYTGDVQVRALLRSSGQIGAVLEPGVQLISGSLQTSGTYINLTLNAAGGSSLHVIFNALLPGGSGVQVHMQAEGDNSWVAVPFASSSSQTTGVLELTHALEGITAARLRVRLTLTGSHTARPAIENLRAVVL